MALLDPIDYSTVEKPSFAVDQPTLTAATEGIKDTSTAATSAIGALPSYTPTAYKAPTDESLLAGYKPAASYVTPQSQVSTQLASLLSTGSPLMEQAATRTKAQANKMGLLSSSMAVGAAQGEMMKQMVPLAMQQADVYAKAEQAKQLAEQSTLGISAEAKISGSLAEQKAAMEADTRKFGASLDVVTKAYSTIAEVTANSALQSQQAMLSYAGDEAKMKTGAVIDAFNATLNTDLKKSLVEQENMFATQSQQLGITAAAAENTRAQSADLIRNYQISVENLLKDPDFSQLGAATVASTLNNLKNQTVAGISFLGSVAKIDVAPYLSQLSSDLRFGA